MPFAQAHQALPHIGPGRHVHAQTIGRVLMHKAPVGACQQALLRLAHGIHILQLTLAAEKLNLSRIRATARSNGIEQSGFARA